MVFTVRPLRTPDEFLQAETVQIEAWGMGERMVTPKDIMRAIQSNGGLVLGAFDGARMVGVALSFLGSRKGKLYMYSHQTGVVREYQSKGVGFLLKQEQKRRAMLAGLDLIAWTFDPLIARNLHFNLNKLGVIFRNYYVNYYGPMNDSINYGWPTDRVLAEWYLMAENKHGMNWDKSLEKEAFRPIKKRGSEVLERCADWSIDLTARAVLLDIPQDIVKLKDIDMQEARRWREATREVYQRYFPEGFSAVSLVKRGPSVLLLKTSLPANIFSAEE